MRKVLVAGATGYLGGFVAREFKNRGYWVRAPARNAGKIKTVDAHIDETFVGEITNPESLNGICKDIDIVFSSIGITTRRICRI